jgi:hypothetical protein
VPGCVRIFSLAAVWASCRGTVASPHPETCDYGARLAVLDFWGKVETNRFLNRDSRGTIR